MNKVKDTQKNICHCNIIQLFPEHRMLQSCNGLIFCVFTTVQTQISVPLELVIKNGLILMGEGLLLNLSLGYQQTIFLLPLWCHSSQ